MTIRLYMLHSSTKSLGPGNRFVIWTQGCNRCCPGCMSPKSRDFEDGEAWDTDVLSEKIINTENIEGITISGGEPFLQAEALCEIIEKIRNNRDMGVIIYTGYQYYELLESGEIAVRKLLSLCDLLIDGPYVEEYNDGKSLRGSSNQKIIPLTERYRGDIGLYGVEEHNMEILIRSDGKARIIGIPPHGMKLY